MNVPVVIIALVAGYLLVPDSKDPNAGKLDPLSVALSLVARGEAPLGIVYGTDAKAEPKVKVIGLFPADSHPPIVYPAALTAGAKTGGAAYLEFLQSSLARSIFEQRGFTFLAKTS